MDYRNTGKDFCNELNNILKTNNINASFVTGGGYAYDSIKYKSDNKANGDFDFMIIYDDITTLKKILTLLNETDFNFEDKYLKLDLNLLESNNIDIIRLSGNYRGIKSTINLVPISLIKRICNFEQELTIKKIAHNRNTSLFFAYGSDNSRIIVNFIAPSFITEDNEDHYIHLDFSHIEKNNNIYLGILADAILKGFNKNYDSLNFSNLRELFINNIYNYFNKNNISSSNYINIFANNRYFPDYIRNQLMAEFEIRGKIVGNTLKEKTNEPVIFTSDFKTSYETNPFNFINNKDFYMSFDSYILKMQDNEYNRQYLLDAIGKFFGYILTASNGNETYDKTDIISKIDVYGTNDLYLKNADLYTKNSIIEAFIINLINSREKYNSELINNLLIISVKFLSTLTNEKLDVILNQYNLNKLLNNQLNNECMNIETILKLNSFNELGTYHNYTSKVMPNYTETECDYLINNFNSPKNKVILDIMCGYGRIANLLKAKGCNKIYGIDTETYDFLNVSKDFTFINDNYLKHEFNQLFNYAYSLYNCYDSNEYLQLILKKTHSILQEDGTFIIDCFNKSWRDQVAQKFEKVLYCDKEYMLIIKRDYDNVKGIEKTWYELYHNNHKIKEFNFQQKFFSKKDVLEVIDKGMWNSEFSDSFLLQARNNSQKHILLLRKK